MGPTASGKTALAVELVERLPGLEIVSVDSAMVYRGMDIGTGKPSREMLQRAPHRLIDIREPCEPYSAAAFRTDAIREIAAIHARGKVPLLVGGTGLYFRALQRGLAPLPDAQPQLRAAIERQARVEGWVALHRRLAAVDPKAAARIHPNDPQRIQRALEVYRSTGRAMSELLEAGEHGPRTHRGHALILEPSDRARLHSQIDARFRQMLDRGLIEEVEMLRADGRLRAELPALRAVGYRQAWAYLHGELERSAMVERAVAATRQLARRQLTWLRAERDATRFDCYAGDLSRAAGRYLAGLLT